MALEVTDKETGGRILDTILIELTVLFHIIKCVVVLIMKMVQQTYSWASATSGLN